MTFPWENALYSTCPLSIFSKHQTFTQTYIFLYMYVFSKSTNFFPNMEFSCFDRKWRHRDVSILTKFCPSPCSIQGNSHLKMAACKCSLLLGISLWFFCFYHDHNGRVQRQTDSLSFYDLVKLCIDIFTSETPWCGKYKNSFVRRDMTRSEMYYVNSLNNAVFAEKKLMLNLFNFLRG